MTHSSRVVVAMSGGVDSSVAAALLVEAGYDCVGVFMRQGKPPETAAVTAARSGHQGCCSVADALDARRVADRLGIPLYPLDLTPDFGRIIDYFAAEYGRGRTPNPCVRCNAWLKFGRLFEHADAIGATHVATGHYARIVPADPDADPASPPRLLRGLETARDQSYVLFDIRPDRLRRMLLPVGGLTKSEVRARAEAIGLVTAAKPDSQEICFVAPGEHAALVAARLGGSRAGEIVHVDGRLLGHHGGIEQFTVGQRQGLGVAVGAPLYVVRIEAESCRVIVGPREAVPETVLAATDVTWLGDPPSAPFECLVQCRAQRGPAPAVVTPHGPDRFTARFTGGLTGGPGASPGPISPGQPAVCYAGEQLLGGGWIE
jgi:tRNA-specific 2-thiouridylase